MEVAPTRPSPLATNHSPLATPLRPLRSRNRDGVALVLTLGLMAMMAILVVSFTLTVRLDRLSARNYRDQVVARQYAQVALDRAMETVDWALFGRLSPFGLDAETGWWIPPTNTILLDQSRNVLGSFATNTVAALRPDDSTYAHLFTGAITNHVPAALWDEAKNIESYWNYIVYEPVDLAGTTIPDATSVTNGRFAFMVLDVSGFLDARHVTSNMLGQLPEYRGYAETGQSPIFDPYSTEYEASIHTFAPFFSLGDLASVLTTRGNDNLPIMQDTPIENLFHLSYDPGPEVWVSTNAPGLGDLGQPWYTLGSRAIEAAITNRFNVNRLTNVLKNAGADDRYSGTEFEAYFGELQAHLQATGIPEPEETAWNIVNALDDFDYIPRLDGANATPWRGHYGLKPTPRINEFVLFEVKSNIEGHDPAMPNGVEPPLAPNTNHYALAVEAWYPFVTNVLADGEAELVVAVFTNASDAASYVALANSSDASDMSDASDVIGEFGFVAPLPAMAYGAPDGYVEFTVAHSQEDEYIHFPVVINRFDPDIVDGVLVGWTPADPPTKTVYLPIGPYDGVPTNVSTDPEYVYEPADMMPPGINTVWFNARIRMQDNLSGVEVDRRWRWVDEAFFYSPNEPFSFKENISASVAWSVIDPRRNTWSEYWTATNATLSEMNAPTHDFFENIPSGGLPIYLPNAPLNRIGDLGAISLGGEDNLWQTIDLTTLEGAHLLDRLTIAETNAPAYGRVHVGTSQTNVIRALLADIEIGWRNREVNAMRHLTQTEIETLADAWFDAPLDSFPDSDLSKGLGQRYAELFEAFGNTEKFVAWEPEGFDPATSRDIKEQVLRGLVDRLSFRQNLFVVIGVGQAISPARRVVGEHRMAALVVRDAYTGRWQRLRTFHLTE